MSRFRYGSAYCAFELGKIMSGFGKQHGGAQASRKRRSDGQRGSFFILIDRQAVELRFDVGGSGVGRIDFSETATNSEDFIKGLVALVVDETEQGNLGAASKVAGLLADYYSRDVLVLDAQMHPDDTLVGEMHFIDGDTLDDRRDRALGVLDECRHPGGGSQVLH